MVFKSHSEVYVLNLKREFKKKKAQRMHDKGSARHLLQKRIMLSCKVVVENMWQVTC